MTKWKGKEVFVEIYPHVLAANIDRKQDGLYPVGEVPNEAYTAVHMVIEEINKTLAGLFRFTFRNNTGPRWHLLDLKISTPNDHARVYFFLRDETQDLTPVGKKGTGNAQSWQRSTPEGYRLYNYPVFALSHNQGRFQFEDNNPDFTNRLLWAMLHEFTHGLGMGHNATESPSVMNGHYGVAHGWDGHYFENDKKYLVELYGGRYRRPFGSRLRGLLHRFGGDI